MQVHFPPLTSLCSSLHRAKVLHSPDEQLTSLVTMLFPKSSWTPAAGNWSPILIASMCIHTQNTSSLLSLCRYLPFLANCGSSCWAAGKLRECFVFCVIHFFLLSSCFFFFSLVSSPFSIIINSNFIEFGFIAPVCHSAY